MKNEKKNKASILYRTLKTTATIIWVIYIVDGIIVSLGTIYRIFFSVNLFPLTSSFAGIETIISPTSINDSSSISSVLVWYVLFMIDFFIILIGFYYFRKILKSLTDNNPFDERNPFRIRIVALCIIISPIYNWFATIITAIFTTPQNGIIKTYYHPSHLFWGIVVLVLAEVFKSAIRLRHENELTI